MVDKQQCRNCRYFVNYGMTGNCHRHAPVFATENNGLFTAKFPSLEAADWCGDWESATDPL